ncbi:ABC transporter ATP-binding protein [Phytomonospora sp. NPDC050363]|uniref:ABC transporter ATP-binding protein n=1 Tax=Phytomonospora sp. NPDC050363 TaxID=3155642 RepID=UPI0033E550D4
MPIMPLADPGTPDARGPGRYLWWLVVRQPLRVLRGSFFGTVWMVGLTLPPYLTSRAIDDGLRARDTTALLWWTAAIVAVGAANALLGMMRHRTMTFIRLDASFRTVQVVVRHATRLGAALPRRMSTGEVIAVGSTDVNRIAQVLTFVGPGVGSIIAYVVVAVLLLNVSGLLAAIVLIGVPAMVLLVSPLLRRLQRVETEYREQQGILTALAGDVVSGLRVLGGIGGKELFSTRYRQRSAALRDEGYRVGAVASWIQACAVGAPALFLAAVIWLGARTAAAGDITVGELVAVYGYVAMLTTPVYFFIETAYDFTRGLVAARRVTNILDIEPDVTEAPASTPAPTGPADLHDPATGLTVPAGVLTVIAAAEPAEALALADRLARLTDSEATWGGAPLASMPLDELRRRVVVADNDAYLFAGSVRDTLTPPGDHDEESVAEAVHTAVADDVVEALPDGLDTHVGNQVRTLSGGQRQRLRLARAVLTRADVLILIEPTSAVDSHTESVIADRLRDTRAGLTTIVVSTSPLFLAAADLVAHLHDGTADTGDHETLLRTAPAYHALVDRRTGDDQPAEASR